MNDKKQLAAMGEHLADQQPLCMAKRIEELEAQVRVMAGLPREAAPMISGYGISTHKDAYLDEHYAESERAFDLEGRIYASLASKMPSHPERPLAMVPEGWQLEALDNDCIVVRKDGVGFYVASLNAENIASTILHALASDMLSSAPSPDSDK